MHRTHRGQKLTQARLHSREEGQRAAPFLALENGARLGAVESVRIDRWLCAARIFKSRTIAHEACVGGYVKLNGASVRPSHLVRIGDRIEGHAPRGQIILEVLALEEKRQSPEKARLLYVDHSPPPPPKEERVAVRARGSGRPTKAERRALSRLKPF